MTESKDELNLFKKCSNNRKIKAAIFINNMYMRWIEIWNKKEKNPKKKTK